MTQDDIIAILAKGPMTTSEIAKKFNREIPQVANVLVRLEKKQKLVSKYRPNDNTGRGRRRVREYRLAQ